MTNSHSELVDAAEKIRMLNADIEAELSFGKVQFQFEDSCKSKICAIDELLAHTYEFNPKCVSL